MAGWLYRACLGGKSGSVQIRTGTEREPTRLVHTGGLTVFTTLSIQVRVKATMESIMAGEACARPGRTWALRDASREESRREQQFYRFVRIGRFVASGADCSLDTMVHFDR